LVRLIVETQNELASAIRRPKRSTILVREVISLSGMSLFLRLEGTRPINERFRLQGNDAFLLVTRMPPRTVAVLSLFLFAASLGLLFASAAGQQSRKAVLAIRPNYSQQDVRLLSAEEINSRTLALVAAVDSSSK
jgi:hypothetical protein